MSFNKKLIYNYATNFANEMKALGVQVQPKTVVKYVSSEKYSQFLPPNGDL